MRGLAEYSSNTKENWRHWVWNSIVERLPEYRPRMKPSTRRRICANKVVVYLPGPNDIDRRIAIKKGFFSRNLIAVDIDPKRVKKVRDAGGIAYCDTLQSFIASLKPSDHIDVINADLCGGINSHVCCLYKLAALTLGKYGILAINLMRGRDPFSNDMRAIINQNREGFNKWSDDYSVDVCKHRGFQLYCRILCDLTERCASKKENVTTMARHHLSANPAFHSYKSKESNLIFDSLVMRYSGLRDACGINDQTISEWDTVSIKRSALPSVLIRNKNPGGCMAALRAVRTKKLAS